MNRPILTWSPGPKSTRVIVMRGSETRLCASPNLHRMHSQQARWWMEAVALWEGVEVPAVICADDIAGSSARALWNAVAMDQCAKSPRSRLDRRSNEKPKRRLMHDCVSSLGRRFEGSAR